MEGSWGWVSPPTPASSRQVSSNSPGGTCCLQADTAAGLAKQCGICRDMDAATAAVANRRAGPWRGQEGAARDLLLVQRPPQHLAGVSRVQLQRPRSRDQELSGLSSPVPAVQAGGPPVDTLPRPPTPWGLCTSWWGRFPGDPSPSSSVWDSTPAASPTHHNPHLEPGKAAPDPYPPFLPASSRYHQAATKPPWLLPCVPGHRIPLGCLSFTPGLKARAVHLGQQGQGPWAERSPGQKGHPLGR